MRIVAEGGILEADMTLLVLIALRRRDRAFEDHARGMTGVFGIAFDRLPLRECTPQFFRREWNTEVLGLDDTAGMPLLGFPTQVLGSAQRAGE